jgi:hypothetical protein
VPFSLSAALGLLDYFAEHNKVMADDGPRLIVVEKKRVVALFIRKSRGAWTARLLLDIRQELDFHIFEWLLLPEYRPLDFRCLVRLTAASRHHEHN